MKTIKIYAVVSSRGDYYECVEKCFINKDKALEYAQIVDESHIHETCLSNDIIDDADYHFYYDYQDVELTKFCKDNNIPTMTDLQDTHFVQRTKEQNKLILDFCAKLDDEYDDWCMKYIERTYGYTEADYKHYLECRDHICDDWNKCKIKEFELAIDNEDFSQII